MRTLTLHRYRTGRTARAVTAAALLVAGACAELTSLEQEAPSRVVANELLTPANAQLLVTGAISDYECALAQYIVSTGLIGDELIDAQLSQQGWDYDRRTLIAPLTAYASNQCTSIQVPGLYTPLNIARYQADVIRTALETWTDAEVPNRVDLIAQAAAHGGYALTLLGEAMCSGAIDGGPELTRAQLFAEAETRFTRAIEAATASGNNAILNMARVGRARVRLNLNRGADARADAALVPAGFVRNANYSAPPAPARRQNLVNTQMFNGLFSSVDPSFRNLQFAGVADPRVPVVDAGAVGHDRTTQIWRTTKYPLASSPIPIASYDEAQLIIAEVDAASGTPTGVANAVAIINDLHARAGIPAYAGGTPAEVQAQVREERRRELFLEGQRFGDIIRLDIPLTPAAGQPFPVKGGVYGPDRGSQVCVPLPDLERNNNPNI